MALSRGLRCCQRAFAWLPVLIIALVVLWSYYAYVCELCLGEPRWGRAGWGGSGPQRAPAFGGGKGGPSRAVSRGPAVCRSVCVSVCLSVCVCVSVGVGGDPPLLVACPPGAAGSAAASGGSWGDAGRPEEPRR